MKISKCAHSGACVSALECDVKKSQKFGLVRQVRRRKTKKWKERREGVQKSQLGSM